MTEKNKTTTPVLDTFYVRAFRFTALPEWLRAWITIAAIIALTALVACTVLSAVLLIRLGWEALWSTPPDDQEIIKNFLLAFASTFGIPFLIWRTWVAHRQATAATAQARVALENHITGIFSKSVELMGFVRESRSAGADGNEVTRSVPNVESRLGALYSLERLLTESARDQRAIIETLCAYIRENSPLEIPEAEEDAQQFFRGDLPPRPTHRADVQAALTIIGRRPEIIRTRAEREGWRLDLRNSNLIGYDFSNLNYDTARYDNSFLNGANMSGARFANCEFRGTFMRGAKMKAGIFHSAHFDDCDLKGAEIETTDFSAATFVDTDLHEARVVSFNIKGANLEKAFPGLEFSVKYFKENGFASQELLGIEQLFQKAIFDNSTSVSDAVREAIMIFRKPRRSSP